MVFSAPFVRPIINHHPTPTRLSSSNGERGLRSRRILVIARVRRLPSRKGADKKTERVLDAKGYATREG